MSVPVGWNQSHGHLLGFFRVQLRTQTIVFTVISLVWWVHWRSIDVMGRSQRGGSQLCMQEKKWRGCLIHTFGTKPSITRPCPPNFGVSISPPFLPRRFFNAASGSRQNSSVSCRRTLYLVPIVPRQLIILDTSSSCLWDQIGVIFWVMMVSFGGLFSSGCG